jgi:Calcineurin-like phosphoesterase
MDRRHFLKLAALGGGAVLGSALTKQGYAALSEAGAQDFYFVQLSDTHWGFSGAPNPEAQHTLQKAVEAVNALPSAPDFIVFTGDLTHTTDDPKERRKRMAEFKEIVSGLNVKQHYYMPGEHDASLDHGEAFKEYFGETHYTFDHKGLHAIVLDNVSDPGAQVGEKQLSWLKEDLSKQSKDSPIVVFTHRPLFDLAPKWDWATRDGAQVIELLMPYTNVTVFYGHIHQEHHFTTGHIQHHAAQSLIFPLPAPGSQEKRTPLPWNPAAPFKGLGFRELNYHQKTIDRKEFKLSKA